MYRESEYCLSGTIATGNASMFTFRYLRNTAHRRTQHYISCNAVTYNSHSLLTIHSLSRLTGLLIVIQE